MKKVITIVFIIIGAISTILFKSAKTFDENIKPLYDENGVLFHTLNFDRLKKDGDLFYYEDKNYYSILGVDVSSYQNDIDFKELKKQGIEFVYIRVGYRGYQGGFLTKDTKFETNYKKAKEAGLKIGVYFFSSAINEEEAKAEAKFILDNIKNKEIDLPLAIDVEGVYDDWARTDSLSSKQVVSNINAFMDQVHNAGYESMLYTNLIFIKENFTSNDLMYWKLWYAQYSRVPDYVYNFDIWQYTCEGELKGIDGYVDINIMFIEKEK